MMKLKVSSFVALTSFCIFMASPTVAILLFGVDKEQAKSARPVILDSTLLSNSDEARNRLISAIMKRSPARREAIKRYHWIQYYLLQYIETDQIVSGKDGWLFYKPQFWKGHCLSERLIRSTLQRVDLLQALGEASGLEIIFSVSPDKASVHPEMLHSRTNALVGCKLKSSDAWRKAAFVLAPRLVDHRQALLSELRMLRAAGDARFIYYATDTHWNWHAAPPVIGDILNSMGIDKTEQVVVHHDKRPIRTDLRNRMLLLDELEPNATDRIVVRRPSQTPGEVIFIHDSFYAKIKKELTAVFANARFFHIAKDQKAYYTALVDHRGPVVVNSVERHFFDRFGDVDRTQLTSALLKRNSRAARLCTFRRVSIEAPIINVTNAVPLGSGRFRAVDRNPQILMALPDEASNCVRLTLTLSKPSELQVYLPPRKGRIAQKTFEEGRSFAIGRTTGQQIIELVLPSDLKERVLRVDLGNGKTDFTIDALAYGRPAR